MVSGRGEGCLQTEKEAAKFNPSSKSCVKEATAGERTLQPTASSLSAAASANGANRCFQTNRPHWRTLSHPLSQFSHRFLSLSLSFSHILSCHCVSCHLACLFTQPAQPSAAPIHSAEHRCSSSSSTINRAAIMVIIGAIRQANKSLSLSLFFPFLLPPLNKQIRQRHNTQMLLL